MVRAMSEYPIAVRPSKQVSNALVVELRGVVLTLDADEAWGLLRQLQAVLRSMPRQP